jgi:hypothetical protein
VTLTLYSIITFDDEELKVNSNVVTCIHIARQNLGKHLSVEANSRNNRTSIAKQRISKHVSLTIETVFSAWSMQRCYKDEFS